MIQRRSYTLVITALLTVLLPRAAAAQETLEVYVSWDTPSGPKVGHPITVRAVLEDAAGDPVTTLGQTEWIFAITRGDATWEGGSSIINAVDSLGEWTATLRTASATDVEVQVSALENGTSTHRGGSPLTPPAFDVTSVVPAQGVTEVVPPGVISGLLACANESRGFIDLEIRVRDIDGTVSMEDHPVEYLGPSEALFEDLGVRPGGTENYQLVRLAADDCVIGGDPPGVLPATFRISAVDGTGPVDTPPDVFIPLQCAALDATASTAVQRGVAPPADGSTAALVDVTLIDECGAPVQGVTVSAELPPPHVLVEPETAGGVTGADGLAALRVYSRLVGPEEIDLRADFLGLPGGIQRPGLFFEADVSFAPTPDALTAQWLDGDGNDFASPSSLVVGERFQVTLRLERSGLHQWPAPPDPAQYFSAIGGDVQLELAGRGLQILGAEGWSWDPDLPLSVDAPTTGPTRIELDVMVREVDSAELTVTARYAYADAPSEEQEQVFDRPIDAQGSDARSVYAWYGCATGAGTAGPLALLAVLLLGLGVVRRRGVLLAAALLLAPFSADAEEELVSMAFTGLTPSSGVTETEARVLGEMVQTYISELGAYRVISMDEVAAMLGIEATKQLLGCNDDSCLTEIGGALGTERLLTGTVSRFGKSFVLHLSLIDQKSTRVLAKRTVTTDKGDDIDALGDLIPGLVTELVMADDAVDVVRPDLLYDPRHPNLSIFVRGEQDIIGRGALPVPGFSAAIRWVWFGIAASTVFVPSRFVHPESNPVVLRLEGRFMPLKRGRFEPFVGLGLTSPIPDLGGRVVGGLEMHLGPVRVTGELGYEYFFLQRAPDLVGDHSLLFVLGAGTDLHL